jgi:hypothetical protein
MVFQEKHIKLMKLLGYDYNVQISESIIQNDIKEILSLSEKILSDKKMFEQAAFERLDLINRLNKQYNGK